MESLPLKDILFYLVAVVMVATALLTVVVKNILHSAVTLSATFFCTAVLYFLLSAEFLGVAQVMVYIGGVIVFVVFTILLTSRLGEYALEAGKLRKIAAAFFSMIIAVLAVVILRESHSSVALEQSDYATLAVIGKRLLSPGDDGFILPFEAISLLLLISLIGAVSIARVPRDDKNKEAE
ncbi:MAG: NADH-quinone oxidoreductase subunit J [Fibromonadaceae bacterium]|jgi:NADH-quinone oxidoreductase subunit J|nr:NADH-quinone oxidoreductase subunit J [Fibromonadaceae bacterium]